MKIDKGFMEKRWVSYTVATCSAVLLYVLLGNLPGIVRGLRGAFHYVSPIVLQGLDPSKRYVVKEINKDKGRTHTRVDGKALGGDALMGMGLYVRLSGDYDSAVIELTAK